MAGYAEGNASLAESGFKAPADGAVSKQDFHKDLREQSAAVDAQIAATAQKLGTKEPTYKIHS